MWIHSRIHRQRPLARIKMPLSWNEFTETHGGRGGVFIQIHPGENLNENKCNCVLSLSAEAVCNMIIIIFITSLWRQMFSSQPACPLAQHRKKYCRQRNVYICKSFPDLGVFLRGFPGGFPDQPQ